MEEGESFVFWLGASGGVARKGKEVEGFLLPPSTVCFLPNWVGKEDRESERSQCLFIFALNTQRNGRTSLRFKVQGSEL